MIRARAACRESWVMLALALVGCGASSDSSSPNPGFERWTSPSQPFDWENSGEVRRVGSWHPNDYALELVSDDASISQLQIGTDPHFTGCFAFTLIAELKPEAEVFLELDFQDDGAIDFSQQIPESDWDRRSFEVYGPSWYERLRFIVRKASAGLAILAELRAQSSAGECRTSRVELNDRPEGARCENNSQCAGGSCSTGTVPDDPAAGSCRAAGAAD